MTQSNNYLISSLEQTAKILWISRKYQHSADILVMATEYAETPVELNALLNNARMCYFQANQVPKALECIQRQLDENLPVDWTIYRDKANYLRYMDRYTEAEDCVELIPDEDTRHLAKSWFLHKRGLYREAFQAAEKARSNYWWGTRVPLALPVWRGGHHKKIVIFGESGSGDEIIFARFIEDVKKYCQELYYYTDSSLSDVICRNFGVKPYKPYITDCVMAPAMSLSYLLDKSGPGDNPYITVDPDLDLKYSKSGPRIGLCFHGDLGHYETALRTLPEDQLINSLKDLGELVNLQYGHKSKNINLVHLDFSAWEETFALLNTCDVVVTCDTSIAHAAGALGKTVIVLMHAAAYFTWNHNEQVGKSSWYKDAWCIKQTEPCQWTGSIEQARKLIIEILGKNEK